MLTTLYSGVFHGSPDQVARVRHELARYLDGCPVIEEAVLVADELAANSVVHSESSGAFFVVRAEVFPDYVWVEVQDLGGVWHPRLPDDRRCHGLDIVEALTGPDNWGVETTTDGGKVVWARVAIRG